MLDLYKITKEQAQTMDGVAVQLALKTDEDFYSSLGELAERELSNDVLDGWENGTPRPPFQYNKYGEFGKQGINAFKYWETKLPYDKLMKITVYEAMGLNPEVKQILKKAAVKPNPVELIKPTAVQTRVIAPITLTPTEIAEQKAFAETLTPGEKSALTHYVKSGYKLITSVLAKAPPNDGIDKVTKYARQQARFEPPSKLGFVPTLVSNFTTLMYRAPKLINQIRVFRGIHSDRALNIDGSTALSTSFDRGIAQRFMKINSCCMLDITVMPGVRIIAVDLVYGKNNEAEIIICPPYTAQIQSIGNNLKKVTISPVKRWRAGTHRRKRRHNTRR